MYTNQREKDMLSPRVLFYFDNKWDCCEVVWTNGELMYYSPRLPRAYPIPPIPFRLSNGSNLWFERYMSDTGIRNVEALKTLIKEYNFDTVKYAEYQVIPSTEDNIERLERLLADQDRLYYNALEQEARNVERWLADQDRLYYNELEQEVRNG